MTVRTRKFIGMLALVTLIVIYAAIGMTLGAVVVAKAPGWVQIIFFIVTGALWVFPRGLSSAGWSMDASAVSPKKTRDTVSSPSRPACTYRVCNRGWSLSK